MKEFNLWFDPARDILQPNNLLLSRWRDDDGVLHGQIFALCKDCDLMDVARCIKQMGADLEDNFTPNGKNKNDSLVEIDL